MIKSPILPRELNWKFALYELILIFIGINLAIWFNNWNQERQLRNLEKETLTELMAALEKDLNNINTNITTYNRRLESYKKLISHFEDNKPYHASLKQDIKMLTGYSIFINNTAPYEVLKSHGFDLVTNDSLRLSILDYYDAQQQIMSEMDNAVQENVMEYFKPLLISHFSLSESKLFEPFNYSELTGNRGVIQVLRWTFLQDRVVLQRYQQMKSNAEKLIQMIQQHIESL